MADRISIEDVMRTYLLTNSTITGLITDRIFPQQAPQNATFPYVVYHRISNIVLRHLGGRAGVSHSRIQLDCYARKYSEAKVLRDAIISLIDPDESRTSRRLWGTVPVQSSIVEDSYDDDQIPAHGDEIGYHCLSMDAIIWFNENGDGT